jgi:hypothetical protein
VGELTPLVVPLAGRAVLDVSRLRDALLRRAAEHEARLLEHVAHSHRAVCMALCSRGGKLQEALAARPADDAELLALRAFYDQELTRALADVHAEWREARDEVRSLATGRSCCRGAHALRRCSACWTWGIHSRSQT